MRSEDKLRASWSKREKDIVLHWPGGSSTKADGHWLSSIFDQEFTDELLKRGYDPTTLRFSVEPQIGNERFTSQKTIEI